MDLKLELLAQSPASNGEKSLYYKMAISSIELLNYYLPKHILSGPAEAK